MVAGFCVLLIFVSILDKAELKVRERKIRKDHPELSREETEILAKYRKENQDELDKIESEMNRMKERKIILEKEIK